jgi:release factor glutamine methyltransferase
MHTDKQTDLLTIDSLLRESAEELKSISPSARLDVELLMGHVLGKSRAELYSASDQSLEPAQQASFINLVSRRHEGRPVAYLVGHREFWSLEIAVTQDTLIPRPETELLVECALSHMPANQPADFLELGTGTGAVTLAVAHDRPDIHITATDISFAALDIARYNAKKLKLDQPVFLQGDWFAPLTGRKFSMIASNPPYVSDMEMLLNDFELQHEPSTALRGGENGLDAIKKIIAEAPKYLFSGGWLAIEHGYRQGPAAEVLLKDAGFESVFAYTDLQGHPRVTEGRFVY